MADGNGINFDQTLPSDNSSVKSGAAEMRNIRNRVRDWAGGVFDTAQTTATFKSSVVSSANLMAASGADVTIATIPADSTKTYTAFSVNAAGQVTKANKASLDTLASLSSSKLSVANLASSGTGGQFLRTNTSATGVEWANAAAVSRWDTSQAATFSEMLSTGRDDAVTAWYGAAWDGLNFALCGAGGNSTDHAIRTSRDLVAFDRTTNGEAGLLPFGYVLKDVVFVKNANAANVSCMLVGYTGATGAVWTNAAPSGSTGGFNGATNGWNKRTFTAGVLNAATSNGTSWVIVGNGGYIYYFATIVDTAGALAASSTVSTSGSDLNDVAYGNNYYVAVGQSGTIKVFVDGAASATSVSVGVATDLKSVVYTGQKWVIVGSSGVVLVSNSSDPTSTWTQITPAGGSVNFTSVDYGNGVLLAVGSNGNIWRSVNGTSWTNVSANVTPNSGASWTPAAKTVNYERVAFCAGTWVILGPSTVLMGGDLPVVHWKAGSGAVWTNNISYVVPHTLGKTPSGFVAELVNLDPQYGYSSGDVVSISQTSLIVGEEGLPRLSASSTHVAFTFDVPPAATSTQFAAPQFPVRSKVYSGSGNIILNAAKSNIDPACWRVRLRATALD